MNCAHKSGIVAFRRLRELMKFYMLAVQANQTVSRWTVHIIGLFFDKHIFFYCTT